MLCRTVERREKEQAMHARFAQRIEQGLDKLGRRLKHAAVAAAAIVGMSMLVQVSTRSFPLSLGPLPPTPQ